MPSQITTLKVVDELLTNIARGYSEAEFIGENLFPTVPVNSETGKIPLWGKGAFVTYNTKRALRGATNEGSFDWFTTDSYQTTEHDLALPVDYREIKEARINLEVKLAKDCMQAVLRGKEKEIADLAQAAGTYPGDNVIAISDDYYDEDAIDWIEKIHDASQTLEGIIGKPPNVMVMGDVVWNALKFHPILSNYLTVDANKKAFGTIPLLQDILEIPKVLVGKSIYTADKLTFTKIWGNNIILAYVTPPSGLERNIYEPCFGYTLQLKGNPYADKYEKEGGKVQFIRSTDNYDIKVVGAESAILISTPITPA